MENFGRGKNIETKRRGVIYFLKRIFNFIPVETHIKTSSADYNVEIKISKRKMKKIVDDICLHAISSL